ncbi:MAG: OTU domain-containing protein [Waddliaceae bacterium]
MNNKLLDNVRLFFTPVAFQKENKTLGQKLTEALDSYLYLGGRKATVIKRRDDRHYDVTLEKSKPNILATIAKVISYCSLVLPFFAFLGKMGFRSYYHFDVKPLEKAPEKVKKAAGRVDSSSSGLKGEGVEGAGKQDPVFSKQVEESETKLWEAYLGNKKMRRFLELVVVNIGENEEKAKLIVGYYIDSSGLTISDDIRGSLVGLVEEQLTRNEKHAMMDTKDPSKVPSRTEGNLRVYSTEDDGSCAFHAFLGEAIDGRYRCDAQSMRNQFCEWLTQRFADDNVPEEINNVLRDYFQHFDHAPSRVKTADVIDLYNQLREGYEDLSPDEKDERINMFIRNKDVFDAYIVHIRDVTTWLLQDELAVAAICFNKTVQLCQPGWGADAEIGEKTLNPGLSEPILVWYNGFNHYERAERTK